MSIPSIKYYLMICSYLHIIYVTILPGQQLSGHDLLTSLEPEHFFPPQEGVGLVEVLVQLCVPSPHVLLHGPQLKELHPPSTTICAHFKYRYVVQLKYVCHFIDI